MMFKKLGMVLLVAVSMTTGATAQKEETVVGSNGMGLSGAWGGYKHQLTRFGETNSYVRGGYFGLEFGRKLFVGFGTYNLQDQVTWDQIPNQSFDMSWKPVIIQYGFNNHKAIHPQIGIEGGRGRVVSSADRRDNIFVVQPTAGLEINIFRWFRLGIDGGYRFVTDSNISGLTDKDLSGAYAQASLKFGYSWGRYHKRKKDKPKHYDDK
jgi:hypothetical protein